jgi:RNA polymerase sigma-70 factor, ECF subfamily
MAPTTRSSLLARLREDGEDAWEEFVRLYTPLLERVAERLSLRGQDVDEVVQGVLVTLFQNRECFTYARARGRFRAYLRQVTVSTLTRLLREARRGGTPMAELPESVAEDDLERRWEEEYQALAQVRREIEPATYQAFDLYALQGTDAREVARFLGISVASVYTSKSRVLERLRPLVRRLMDE